MDATKDIYVYAGGLHENHIITTWGFCFSQSALPVNCSRDSLLTSAYVSTSGSGWTGFTGLPPFLLDLGSGAPVPATALRRTHEVYGNFPPLISLPWEACVELSRPSKQIMLVIPAQLQILKLMTYTDDISGTFLAYRPIRAVGNS